MAVIRCVLSPCSCEPTPPALQAFAREPFEPLPLLGYMGPASSLNVLATSLIEGVVPALSFKPLPC